MLTMSQGDIEAFIARARIDGDLQKELSDCSLEKWSDTHIPLDIDQEKVIKVASAHGFRVSLHDIVVMQCKKLTDFWQFEMENSFVARRSLRLIQYQISGRPESDTYENYCP